MSSREPSEDTSRWIGHVIAGRYRLVRLVGQGGMGAVFEAQHVQTEKQLAVKLLADKLSRDLKLIARFRREALAASRLDHENCVRVYDYGQDDDGTFYIVMEFIEGIGLNREVRTHGPLNQARTARIAVQLLGALDAAHAEGVLHRDLKPPNVMLTRLGGHSDVVKVVDFGIAKLVESSAEDQAALTIPGTIFGTPEYMSPEQARGEPLDARSDQFSAGAVIFHLMLGRSPFRGATVRDTLTNVFSLTPPSPRDERPDCDISPEFEAVIRRAISKTASARYPDTAAFLAAVQPFAEKTSLLPSFTQRPPVPGVREDGSVPETIPGSGPVPAGYQTALANAATASPEAQTASLPTRRPDTEKVEQGAPTTPEVPEETLRSTKAPSSRRRAARYRSVASVVGVSVTAGVLGAGFAWWLTGGFGTGRQQVTSSSATPDAGSVTATTGSTTTSSTTTGSTTTGTTTTVSTRDAGAVGTDPVLVDPAPLDPAEEVKALRAALAEPGLPPEELLVRAQALLALEPEDGATLFKAANAAYLTGDKPVAREYLRRLEALGGQWAVQVKVLQPMMGGP